MSATETHHDAGHHEPPEVVDGRQRMAIWLFIGGDMVGLSAIFFTYLYLRGVNTGGHWMSMWGYQGHSYAYYEKLVNGSGLPANTLIHIKPMNASLNWTVTLVTVLSAAVIWFGEKVLRKSKSAKAYSLYATFGTLIAVVAVVLSIVQLRHVPEVFVANNDAQGMAYTAYSSAMLIIIGSALFHLLVLVFLGLGLAIRSARGVINGEKWYQARLVRLFWVWVAVSAVLASALTTTVNTLH
jgi:heme/copper-type cytochrome/quinol oxidase subunit 3